MSTEPLLCAFTELGDQHARRARQPSRRLLALVLGQSVNCPPEQIRSTLEPQAAPV